MRIPAALCLVLLPTTLRAEPSTWFDPKMGCGPVSAYAKTGRAADLPGCTGRLPKDAPAAEVALRELKEKLIEAEELVEKGKLDRVDALLADVEAGLAKTPPAHKDLPDRWEQASNLYRKTVARLRNRRRLIPQEPAIRAAHAAALEADRTRNKKEIDGGPAETVKAAQACLSAVGGASSAGVDPATPVEMEKKAPPRPLGELGADCDKIRRSAETLSREQEKAKAKLAKKRGKGSRRKN